MIHLHKKTAIFLITFLLLISVGFVRTVCLSKTQIESVYGVYKFDKTLSQYAYWQNIYEAPTFIFLKDNFILDFGKDNYGVYSFINYKKGTVSDHEFSGIDISRYKNRKKYAIISKEIFTRYTIYVMDKEVWLSVYDRANTPYIFRIYKIDVQKS